MTGYVGFWVHPTIPLRGTFPGATDLDANLAIDYSANRVSSLVREPCVVENVFGLHWVVAVA